MRLAVIWDPRGFREKNWTRRIARCEAIRGVSKDKGSGKDNTDDKFLPPMSTIGLMCFKIECDGQHPVCPCFGSRPLSSRSSSSSSDAAAAAVRQWESDHTNDGGLDSRQDWIAVGQSEVKSAKSEEQLQKMPIASLHKRASMLATLGAPTAALPGVGGLVSIHLRSARWTE